MNRIEALRSAITNKADRANELRSTLQEYITRDGDPTADERSQFEADTAEFAGIEPELERMRSELAQLERIANAPEQAREVGMPAVLVRQANPLDDESVQYGSTEQVRGAARTAVERLPHAPDHVRNDLYRSLERADDSKGTLARHMIAASRPTYRSAFAKLVSGQTWSLTADESRAVEHVRTAGLTDSLGGFAVPTVLDPTLILTGVHDGLVPNPVRQLANVRQITGDNLNLVSTAGVSATWAAEGAEATDGSPTLANLTLTPYKAHLAIPFTVEIQGDWSAMEAEMRRLMMVAKDDLEADAFINGTGSTRPLGLFYDVYTNYTGQVQASAGANTFTAPDIYALAQKVAARYRGRGVWIANEITYDRVRGFATSSIKDIFQESIALGRPGTILGAEAYGSPVVDATFGSGENYIMAFGDIRAAYTIVDRVGMSVELVPHLLGTGNNLPNGTRALYTWWRTGGRVVDSGAVAVLNIT
jgi:HK97 family phage major capsid protein